MSGVLPEIVVIVMLMLANGVLAMSEIAIVSARRSRLQQMQSKGMRGARLALELAEEPTGFLATVQIGITLIGIVSGAYGGVTIGEELGASLTKFPGLAEHGKVLGVGLVVVVITYLSLVVGELVPKRLALMYAETIAVRMAGPLRVLQQLSGPVAWLLTASTKGLLWLARVHPRGEAVLTDEDLLFLVRQGARDGALETSEQDMIEGVLELDLRPLGAVMTPRHRVVWLEAEAEPEQVFATVTTSPYSLYPVCQGSMDTVVGVVKAGALLAAYARQLETRPVELMSPPLFLPENVTTLDALMALRESGVHLALVVDEYGGIQGLVTLNDILSAVVGPEVVGQAATGSAVQRPDGSYLVDGMMAMDELEELLNLEANDESGTPAFYTVAGLAMSELGVIPQAGDAFDWRGFRFEIVDMDGHRVDKLLIARLSPPTAEDRVN